MVGVQVCALVYYDETLISLTTNQRHYILISPEKEPVLLDLSKFQVPISLQVYSVLTVNLLRNSLGLVLSLL